MSFENASLLAQLGFIAIGLGLVFLVSGFIAINTNKRTQHKWLMFLAVLIDGVFLILYVSRYLTEGNVPFKGDRWIFLYIYVPILSIHILTAIVSIFFVLRQVKSGYYGQKYTETGIITLTGNHRESHKKYGKLAVYVWGSSFIGGIIVFILLYII